jgi:PTH2 family peptidyl-tRNA hydrolase
MNDPKQVIIIRKDLNMRKGKMIAQGSHASLKVIFDLMTFGKKTDGLGDLYEKTFLYVKNSPMDKWINGLFKKIVVGSENLENMVKAYTEAKLQKLPCSLIEDKGLTEFGGKITITACAIGPGDPKKIDKITGKFKLL